jgi:uncharacterized protein (DUF1778 family)
MDIVAVDPSNSRRERLEARLSSEQKRLLERAAAIRGQTLSDFVVGSARKAAEETIREHEVIGLCEQDARRLMDALLDPRPANPRLRRAAGFHRSMLGDG